MTLLTISVGLAHPETPATRIVVSDERTQRLSVSSQALTVLVFPAPVLQAVTSSAGLELKTQDRHVIVAAVAEPSDLVVVTGQFVYVFTLHPSDRPPGTIHIEDLRLKTEEGGDGGAGLGEADDYTDELMELVSMGLTARWPRGAEVTPLDPETLPRWLELSVAGAEAAQIRRAGGWFEVRRLRLRNATEQPLSLREQEFYTGQELAVALDRQVADPQETLVVCVVLPGRDPQQTPAGHSGEGPRSDADPAPAGLPAGER